jgi:hypothetical protein
MITMEHKKILDCEIGYSKCFASANKIEGGLRFRDSLLKDMYYHTPID